MTWNPGATGDRVYVNGNFRTVYRITPGEVAASSTDTPLIAASGTSIIRILSLHVQIGATATAVTIKGKVGVAASTALSPAWEFGANGGIVLPGSGEGQGCILDTAAGAAVTVTTGSGSTSHIGGTYCLC